MTADLVPFAWYLVAGVFVDGLLWLRIAWVLQREGPSGHGESFPEWAWHLGSIGLWPLVVALLLYAWAFPA